MDVDAGGDRRPVVTATTRRAAGAGSHPGAAAVAAV